MTCIYTRLYGNIDASGDYMKEITGNKYPILMMWLHWVYFFLILLTYISIEFRGIFPEGGEARAYMKAMHFTLGSGTFLLMLLRLWVAQIYLPIPAIVPHPPVRQFRLSFVIKAALLLLFVVIPVLGAITLYIKGVSWSFLGIKTPTLYPPEPAVASAIKNMHELLAKTGYFLMGVHASAALFHHYYIKDNTLKRMLP